MKLPQVFVVFIVMSIVLSRTSSIVAAEITVISPASAADGDGDGRVPAGNGPGRIQFLYPVEDFSALPSTHRVITGFAWRPDVTNTKTDAVTVPARFRLSSTPATDLGTNFESNRGLDGAPLAFDGTLTFQTDNQPPGPGPRNFDYFVKFQQPFEFDPSEGNNLLLEFEILARGSSVGDWFIDSSTVPGRNLSISATSLNATDGGLRGGAWPAEFTFVPEPSSSLLGLSALGGCAMVRRRRR